jgi:hypothetical protein
VHDDAAAIILAGGERSRLRSLTRRLVGDDRPKQFCPVLGGETLLAQTRRRATHVAAPSRTFDARIGTPWETEAARVAYADLAPADFSRDVLERRATRLAVLPVSGTAWNDLGDPARALAARQRFAGEAATA